MLNLLNLVVQFSTIRKRIPEIIYHLSLRLGELQSITRYHFWYWLQSAIALLGFLSDKFFVAYFFDLKTLGYYSLGSLIAIQIHNILLAFGSFIFPKVSFHLQSNKKADHIFQRSSVLINSFGWLILISLLLSGPFIFKLWLGEQTYTQAIDYINLCLVFESAILLIIVPYHFLNGTDHVKLNSLFEIILRGSHIAGMFIGYYFGGSTGVIWGLIVATLINIPFQYAVFYKTILRNVDFDPGVVYDRQQQ